MTKVHQKNQAVFEMIYRTIAKFRVLTLKNRLLKLISSMSAISKECILKNTVSIGYYNIDNFGDQLTPDILSYYGMQTAHCPNFRFSRAIGVGSILHLLPRNYSGYILGSGLIKNETTTFPKAKILLVRGNLTKKNLALMETIPVGDPGLISDKVYESSIVQKPAYDLGIVMHYKDQGNSYLTELIEKNTNLIINVIDVKQSPKHVVREISKCNFILSSSLHGLIVSDSLGIKNHWVKLSDNLIGGGFKFKDYYSCFDLNRQPIMLDKYNKINQIIDNCNTVPDEKINAIKKNIHLAYSEFSERINVL